MTFTTMIPTKMSCRLSGVALLVLLLVAATTTAHASSWFGGSEDDSNNGQDKKELSALVSPVINRELETSVVAHTWPSNPQSVICEAYAYYQSTYSNDGPRQKLTAAEKEAAIALNHEFLEALSNQVLSSSLQEDGSAIISTYAAARDLVLKAVTPSSSQSHLLLLDFVLSMRGHSPHCELHRGLARQTLQQRQQLATFGLNEDVFAVVYPGGHVVKEADFLAATTNNDDDGNDGHFDWKSLAHDVVTDTDDDPDELLLPGELPFGADRSLEEEADDAQLVILYANLGSASFAKAYTQLYRTTTTQTNQNIRFVVRHLGAVHYEEMGPDATTQPTVLQGYGVRLDIRNAEYKVFDDRKDAASNSDASVMNVTALAETAKLKVPSQLLAGVNLTALGLVDDSNNDDESDGDDDSTAKKHTILQELWKKHEAQQANLIPPKWQRRKLSLQATSVIAASKDPLMTLEEVSLNLPSVASTLVHCKIPNAIQEIAEKLETELEGVIDPSGALLINGKPVAIDRPTFNVFELIAVLRKEQAALEKIQVELGPHLSLYPGVLGKVKDAWTRGSDFFVANQSEEEDPYDEAPPEPESKTFRIDVGRGWKQAVVYLNDIEKDSKYAQWPKSVRQMLMAMQYGMPPSVRRNFFTVLAVTNPLDSNQNVGITLAKQLLQSNYPARLGVLLVDNADVKSCAEWVSANPSSEVGEACPVVKGPIIEEDVTFDEKDKLKDTPGTMRAFHSLFTRLVSKHSNDMADAYLENVMRLIDEQKEVSGESSLSMFDLLEIHTKTMRGMNVGSVATLWKEALALLTDAEDDDDEEDTKTPKYTKALRFAVDKGLETGMSFLNGIPLPIGEPEDVFDRAGKVFNQEMGSIFMKIQSGDITDDTPRSVYASFLKGKGVFKKVHPLIMASRDKSDSYMKVPHQFDSKSLIFPAASNDKVDAVFVLDAVLDVGSPQGLQLAKSLVSVMDSYPAVMGDDGDATIGIKIGYRIIPSKASDSAKALCPILANAGEVGATGLSKVLEKADAAAANGTTLSLDDLMAVIPDLGNSLKAKMQTDFSDGVCSRLITLKESPGDNFVVSNGLFYALEGSTLAKDDVELLLTLDLTYSKTVTAYLKSDISSATPEGCESIGRCISYLAVEAAGVKTDRVGLEYEVEALEKKLGVDKNPLRFSWNQDGGDDLKLKITAFINPTSEMTQRAAPILRVLRDSLQLPLTVVILPKVILEADAKVPITSFYRFVADSLALQDSAPPKALFSNLPMDHTLTVRMDVPESWDIQQSNVVQDTDNLRCEAGSGCGDAAHSGSEDESVPLQDREHITRIEYGLNSLLVFGQCYETGGSPPNGLQLTLKRRTNLHLGSPQPKQEIEVGMDGTVLTDADFLLDESDDEYSTDTLVMKTVGYWQLRAGPGVWNVQIEKTSKGAEIFDITDGMVRGGQIKVLGKLADNTTKQVVMKDFVNRGELLLVQRRKGFEKAKLFSSDAVDTADEEEVIHVFSLATGHLYERFLKIMMLSVTRRTSTKVKFWLFENFLSPSFKASARYMAAQIGCEVEFVTYKWPEWLRGQSEKQRIIWGYKILFLDVLFPLNVKKIIYVDADQVIRGDLKELWDMDLEGAPYGYTPMCSSRKETLGFQFWRGGFWESHLRGKPYHISALYVVDLVKFRKDLVGDQLRATYQQLSADPNSLSNLDQDLPNYAQHQVPIFSLPQEWLWCESWCSDETKATSKTIDLCNNPLHKEPKVSMAKRVISGDLFEESWVQLDEVVDGYQKDWLDTTMIQ